MDYVEQHGPRWLVGLREMLASITELWVKVCHIEVVALRSREEEMAGFEVRPRTYCSPHHIVGATADRGATIPAVGSLKHMQWYGELACVQDPMVVLELALAPSVDVPRFLSVLCQRLTRREGASLSRRDATASALSEVVPRQVARLYEWPPEAVPGEARRDRHTVRGNPPVGWAHRQASDPAHAPSTYPSLPVLDR